MFSEGFGQTRLLKGVQLLLAALKSNIWSSQKGESAQRNEAFQAKLI